MPATDVWRRFVGAESSPVSPKGHRVREPVIPQFDEETYLLWEGRQPERFELHHGFVVAFAGGTLDHSQIALNLQNTLARLYPAPCRPFGPGVKVRIDRDTFFYSDAGIVCAPATGTESVIEAPAVVCEVLSPATHSYDLIEKRVAYRSLTSLDAYVVVHTTHRRIDLDLRNPDRSWRTVTFDLDSHPLGDGTFSLDDVYARTTIR